MKNNSVPGHVRIDLLEYDTTQLWERAKNVFRLKSQKK